MKNVNIEFIFDDEKKTNRGFQEFREAGSTRECSTVVYHLADIEVSHF